jgi:Ctr copper transporter family
MIHLHSSLLAYVSASTTNGIDPSMDMPMNLASGRMIPYLHFTPGDVLWFQGWVPGRSTTLFGACVGLFVLALLHRWIVALRAALELGIASVRFVCFALDWCGGYGLWLLVGRVAKGLRRQIGNCQR